MALPALWRADAEALTSTSAGKIAFASDGAGNFELYLLNPDGSGLQRLTEWPGDDFVPAWSPDGRRIAFARDSGYLPLQSTSAFASLDDENFDIYVANADGSGLQRLTSTTGDPPARFCDEELDPSWSPDGKKLAFVHNHAGRFSFDIYVMNADGSQQQRLTRNKAADQSPAWSPDGTKIAFARGRQRGVAEVYVMNANGSGQRRLSRYRDESIADFGCATPLALPRPTWSPDGRTIAFEHARAGNLDIYVMNAGGGGRRRLTRKRSVDAAPAWSPDGRQIAFASDRAGDVDIYVMNADGSGLRRLVRTPGTDAQLAWSRDGGGLP